MQYLKTYLFLAPILIAGFLAWRQLLRPGVRHWANYRMLAMAFIPAAGLVAPSIWIYYGVLLACMVFVPRSRVEASGLYILLALTLPFSTFYVRAGSALLFPLTAISVLSLGLLASLRFLADGEPRVRKWTQFDSVFLAMWLLLIVIDTRNADVTVNNVLRHTITSALFLVVPFWILSRTPISQIDPRRMLHYIAMAGFILSLEALFELSRSWPLYGAIDANLGTGALSKSLLQRGGLLRASGPYAESTTFGIILAISATIVFAQKSMFRSPLAHWVAVGVCCVGCFSALGRSGWVALIVGILMASMFSGRIGVLTAMVFSGVTSGIAFFLLIAESGVGGELIGTSGHAAGTIDYRRELLDGSWPFIEQNPLLGTPLNEVMTALGTSLVSGTLTVDYVNSYLYFLVVSGIFGLLIFSLYLLFPVLKNLLVRRQALAAGYNGEFATALFGTSVAFALVMAFTSYFERLPFIAMLLIAGVRQLHVRLAVEKRVARSDRESRRLTAHHQPLRASQQI